MRESAALRAESFFEAIAANTTDAIFVKDLEGRYAYINEAGARFLGKRVTEIVGRDDKALFSADTAHEIMRKDRLVITGGKTVTYEDTGTAAGATRVYLSTKGVVRDPAGRPIGLFGISRDITGRKATHSALARAERLASLGVMAAGLAHEINNPLASILIAARAAMERVSERGDDETARHLESILRNTERCGQIVRSVLRFFRDEPSEKEAMDLNDVVRRGIDVVRQYAETQGASLRAELAESLPAVSLNAVEFEQVVVNLVRNGIEAGDRGGTVSIGTVAVGGCAVLRVRDNGRGMTEEQRRHVFDPFFSTRRAQGGSGLGMSLVQAIVASHNASIDIKSLPGWGTEVTVTIPPARD